ncbi:GntR family transcriptional regulator [Microvirga lotononidis]|uniref:Putative transcriptional regulator n=1 Tax=Microvirga lotononidis TaxID=864069 RepID=I4YL18_9HYPH|nr:GntR family transcriptional regulator [Microvirga lotononidis]EIM24660.1 putative transcriptional regulator [Microvirga lotononidis]WQO26674.1 GntR family transcriptional regulator [Microvirga lotononidis]
MPKPEPTSVAYEGTRYKEAEQTPDERIVANLAAALDRSLPVPLGIQLRGLIEFGIALGELPTGQRLPSVRELAERAGIAHMTVATVYRELREAGLIESKPGAGTYVGDGHSSDGLRSSAIRKIQNRIETLFNEAEQLGLAPSVVSSLVNARAARGPTPSRALRLVMVGNFVDTTRQYANRIQEYLGAGDTIMVTTVDALHAGETFPLPCDVCVTLAHRRGEVEHLVPTGIPVVGLSFIPAEETRAQLAMIDPMARIGIVSIFPEFTALMKPGVLRFAPHVSDVDVRLITAPDLGAFLSQVDVAIYASGAEATVRKMLPKNRQAMEFRYVPDPHAIRATLLPVLERLRSSIVTQEEDPS